MNFEKIIEKEGYRYEDLSDEHKKQIDILNCLKEDFDNFDANLDAYCDICDDESILSKIEMEIAEKVIEGVKLWLDSTIAEYQVKLAEQLNSIVKTIPNTEGSIAIFGASYDLYNPNKPNFSNTYDTISVIITKMVFFIMANYIL